MILLKDEHNVSGSMFSLPASYVVEEVMIMLHLLRTLFLALPNSEQNNFKSCLKQGPTYYFIYL